MSRKGIGFRVMLLALAAALVAGVMFTPFASGSSLEQAEEELSNLKNKQSSLQSELKDGRKKANELNSKIQVLEQQIYSAQSKINDLQRNINATKERIAVALAEMEKLQADMDAQNEALNARLRAMYKNGGVGMLAVLLGSNSMSDFMTNMDMVERIYESDADLLASIQAKYEAVEEHRAKLQALGEQLSAQQQEQERMKVGLETDRSSVSALKKEVDADNANIAAQIEAINKEANALSAKIRAMQSNKDYVGGKMCWPSQASTRITSPFGRRIHPILKIKTMHTGVDIGAAGGTNILAANSGTVITAGYNRSYGYMVMIDHGGGIVTLYAHSSKLLVKKGDEVSRGQAIALIGSTGMSTGNHLHFEVRVNGAYKNPMDYISTSVRK